MFSFYYHDTDSGNAETWDSGMSSRRYYLGTQIALCWPYGFASEEGYEQGRGDQQAESPEDKGG